MTKKQAFDPVIGDEAYEIFVVITKDPVLKPAPLVFILDFIGMDSVSNNPLEKLGVYFWNRVWAKDYKRKISFSDLTLFVGEAEDIPDKTFGFLLPNRREYARDRNVQFVGNVLPFEPAQLANPEVMKNKLGYGPAPS